ncbi:copper resistance system multicopper oxidase [Methylorubrum thiocyanatum]|uniref:copper resistance system multicopper oxidase n=1 Tax=Methylorubrum thiocyanatum TaxID=47958 RepID=UPI0035C7C896
MKAVRLLRLIGFAALLVFAILPQLVAAATHDLVLERRMVNVTGRDRPAMLINGQLPGPTLRLQEGEDAIINVTNRLEETASIHWHGLIVPPEMDGVPGISPGYGNGIPPGQTFTYRFKVRQSGTYWYHSHSSGEQEQLGIYAPLIIEPREREPFRYDRDYVIMLSDWTDEDPRRILKNLKTDSSWYNLNRRTMASLIDEMTRAPGAEARRAVVEDRVTWDMMRMDPTDIADIGGLTYLVNGQSPERNFTALFRPGERVRLRFINASAMTYFDVRIPGVKMTVVQADGQNVQPVRIDEFRFGNAETYDVIVQPAEDRAYTIVAEPIDRTGFARATLAPRPGMVGELPPHRLRPLVSMAEMGMNFGPKGHDRGTPRPEQDMPGHVAPEMPMGAMDGADGRAGGHGGMPGMAGGGSMPPDGGSGMNHSRMANGGRKTGRPAKAPAMPGMDHGAMPGMSSAPAERSATWAQMQGMDHGSMPGLRPSMASPNPAPPVGVLAAATGGLQPGHQADRLHGGEDMPNEGPMIGHAMPDALVNRTGAPPGTKVLSYRDLKALKPYPYRKYDRIIEMRLTGNMQRYFWSINGRKFSEAQPIVLRYGERARFRFINETMMPHPMHIHGTWFLPEVGNGARSPLKHTVNINPGATLDVDVPADAEGPWAFHCHQLYHMEAGMMRKIIVQRQPATQH